jgi:hypothetical protein
MDAGRAQLSTMVLHNIDTPGREFGAPQKKQNKTVEPLFASMLQGSGRA